MMGFDSSSFRVVGKRVYYLFNREWLQIWKMQVVENRGDIAIDFLYDSSGGKINITTKDKPVEQGWSRHLPHNDVLTFDLENGKTVTIEMTPPMFDMVRELLRRGLGGEIGVDCSEEFVERVQENE